MSSVHMIKMGRFSIMYSTDMTVRHMLSQNSPPKLRAIFGFEIHRRTTLVRQSLERKNLLYGEDHQPTPSEFRVLQMEGWEECFDIFNKEDWKYITSLAEDLSDQCQEHNYTDPYRGSVPLDAGISIENFIRPGRGNLLIRDPLKNVHNDIELDEEIELELGLEDLESPRNPMRHTAEGGREGRGILPRITTDDPTRPRKRRRQTSPSPPRVTLGRTRRQTRTLQTSADVSSMDNEGLEESASTDDGLLNLPSASSSQLGRTRLQTRRAQQSIIPTIAAESPAGDDTANENSELEQIPLGRTRLQTKRRKKDGR